jgi:hypothetical protein
MNTAIPHRARANLAVEPKSNEYNDPSSRKGESCIRPQRGASPAARSIERNAINEGEYKIRPDVAKVDGRSIERNA